jgi:hypothetical protein
MKESKIEPQNLNKENQKFWEKIKNKEKVSENEAEKLKQAIKMKLKLRKKITWISANNFNYIFFSF